MSTMRLTCPACGARYEVSRDVIPPEGRDVQCSACGHTWFQTAARDPDPLPLPDPAGPPVGAEDGAAAAPRGDRAEDDWPEDDDPEPHAPPPSPPPRDLPPPIRDIFRQEREHEDRLRRDGALETQPDLGLEEPSADDQARRAREARDRMVQIRRDGRRSGAGGNPAATSRRDLLPDVDEITQSLRSEEPVRRAPPPPRVDDAPGGGFARGFLLAAALGAAAFAVYVYAPDLADMLPQAEPALGTYVGAVDDARRWLDLQAASLLAALDRLSSEAAGAGS